MYKLIMHNIHGNSKKTYLDTKTIVTSLKHSFERIQPRITCDKTSLSPALATDLQANVNITSLRMDQLTNIVAESKQLLYYLSEGRYDYRSNGPILGTSEKNFYSDPTSYRKLET